MAGEAVRDPPPEPRAQGEAFRFGSFLCAVLLGVRLPAAVLVLTSVEIENFQSLKRVSVRLGRFTVVTGATGSGKSGLLRALALLAFNTRGAGSSVTRGEKSCKVGTGSMDEAWAVGIERGVARGKDCYRRVLAEGAERQVETYTKLGGDVPEAVSAVLALSDLNFAGQFDRPFLLDSSGGEVARTLGKLTNVTLLFNAARECNRRRLEVAGDLKHAERRLADLAEQAQRFAGMRERRAAAEEAEEGLERVHDLTARAARLRVLSARLGTAQAALEAASPPPAPDGAALEELAHRLVWARDLHDRLAGGIAAAREATRRVQDAADAERAAHDRLHEVLVAAGQCPTCGQEVR